ncbi:meiotic recombination protein REC8 homolog [Neosynchiropus ocellatus]
MFYYPTVLQRHGGCFATIWLVATKGISVPRRDILQVNVVRTCDDIMDYVLERVQPPRPDLPRPRFSLYLSSQLQYGVVVVYHRQCTMFLEELQTFLNRLFKSKGTQRIDLADKIPPPLLKDALTLMLETEGAPDPLFGRMHDMMPSPRTVIEMERSRLRDVSPEQSALILTSPASAVSQRSSKTSPHDFTVSPESITLREPQLAASPSTEVIPAANPFHPNQVQTSQIFSSLSQFEGAELPEGGKDMVDFLLGQEDYFTAGNATEREQPRTEEIFTTTQDQQVTLPAVEETTQLPQEELGLTVEPPRPLAKHLIQESHPPEPSSPGAEGREHGVLEFQEELPPVAKKRRRKLVLFDTETQLSDETMQQQIQNPLTETRRPLLLPPPSHLRIPAAELFRKPCTFLAEDVLSLWRQAATITPVSGSDPPVRGSTPESSDAEKERVKRQEESEGPEFPSEVSLPHLEGSVPHEGSREMSSEKEASVSSRTATLLEDIPETANEPAAGLPAEQTTPVSFQSLLARNASRGTVARAFRKLLGILESRTLSAEQTEPYGDIIISPGVNSQSVQV